MSTEPLMPNAAEIDPQLYQRLLETGDGFLAQLQLARADGRISLSEAWGLFIDFAHRGVLLADLYGKTLTGAQKRQVVDAAMAATFDLVWPYVTQWGYLSAFRFLPQVTVRGVFLWAIDQVIEGAYRFQHA
jgi:hypothetical protein